MSGREETGNDGAARRPAIRIAALAAAAALAVLAGLGLWSAFDRIAVPEADPVQLEALRAKLVEVRGTIEPIAVAFTSQPDTAAIDVTDYRSRIARARLVVESVNDLQATSAEALDIRDSILTGGTQVLDGMDIALDALVADEAGAAADAATQVEEGLTLLEDAKAHLDEMLGRRSTI